MQFIVRDTNERKIKSIFKLVKILEFAYPYQLAGPTRTVKEWTSERRKEQASDAGASL